MPSGGTSYDFHCTKGQLALTESSASIVEGLAVLFICRRILEVLCWPKRLNDGQNGELLEGYSGKLGVLISGCQSGSTSVDGLSSWSPSRIAVIGRQKLKKYLLSQQAI